MVGQRDANQSQIRTFGSEMEIRVLSHGYDLYPLWQPTPLKRCFTPLTEPHLLVVLLFTDTGEGLGLWQQPYYLKQA